MRQILSRLALATLSVVMIMGAFACEQSTKGEKGYSIIGEGNLDENLLIVLNTIENDQLKIVDSAYAKKGKFEFAGEGKDQNTIYYITLATANPPGIPLVIKNGDKIKLSINRSDVIKFTAEGGDFNKHMVKLHNIYTDYDRKMLAFNAEVKKFNEGSGTAEEKAQIPIRYNAMIQERSDAIENFIKNEPASPATYFACKFLFQKPVAKLIFLGSAKMKEELPESDYTKRLVADAAKLPKTTEGAIAPEISLLSPEGDSVSLSDLRGKVVLIDFWASWCGPCRKENPNVKRVYDKFKDKGFEIYGVSLDDNAGRWKAAIAKDGLPWYHVSDLKGWRSSAAQLYGVHSIPQTFLIDKDGTIIKAGLRGPELEMYLDRLMGS